MKYCRNCGKELNSDIQYCPNCGASVSEEQSGKNENSYQERKIYKKLMVIGRATGCHQLPERSFSFRGKQFPVCARCTGVFIGEVLGIFLFKVGEISNIIAVVFSLIMFADWFVQYKFHYESNNIRRLITGLLCGYAFGNIIMKYLRYFM